MSSNKTKQNETVLKWHSEFLVPLNTAKKAPQMFTIYVTIYEKKNVENDRNPNIF